MKIVSARALRVRLRMARASSSVSVQKGIRPHRMGRMPGPSVTIGYSAWEKADTW